MEHKIAIEKEIIVTTQDIVDCVLCCEAGGFDYWGELCSDEKDYEAARERLQANSTSEIPPRSAAAPAARATPARAGSISHWKTT